jgi:ADP-dependent NAD(P)H-hydrate dehydratase / NAD(P)H-hydrate epimerase
VLNHLDQITVANWLPPRVNAAGINKSTYGHVAIVGGSSGLLGAPILSSHAAMRAGSGLVTVLFPAEFETLIVSRLSPVIMTRPLKSSSGTVSSLAIEVAIELSNRATAVGLGPGLGQGRDVNDFVRSFVAQCQRPLVLDADALNALALDIGESSRLLRARKFPTVLTPHPKELARLLSISTTDVQFDREQAVKQAFELYGCSVVLKGHRTLIGDPTGTIYENSNGNVGMATAGSGDVLTGIISAFLAGGLAAPDAAAAGVFVHGLAGDLAGNAIGGMTGLIATDIIDSLPRAIAHVHAPHF